jgi:hypothetical protein
LCEYVSAHFAFVDGTFESEDACVRTDHHERLPFEPGLLRSHTSLAMAASTSIGFSGLATMPFFLALITTVPLSKHRSCNKLPGSAPFNSFDFVDFEDAVTSLFS